MSDFGIERFSDEARERMAAALSDVGLAVDPPLSAVDRSQTVVLSLAASDADHRHVLDPLPLEQVVTVRSVGEGGALTRTTLDELGPHRGIRWFDIANSGRVKRGELEERLGPLCHGELTSAMLDDVLSPDPRPGIKQDASNPDVRCVSAFQVSACESDEGADPDSTSKAGVLVFEPIEFLVGSDWVITCWHDVEVYRGADRIREGDPAPPADLFAEVERCWARMELETSGDLATLVLRELSLTYSPAYQQFYAWEDEWELDFYRRPERVDRATLLEVRAAAAVLRDWLSPLSRSGVRQDPNKAWFSRVTGSAASGGHQVVLRTDEQIEECLAGLRDFANTLRSAYDLLQLREADRERERDDRFQRNIAVGGSVILIPTLVAGIMGANTWVPGQWQENGPPPHWDFAVLLTIVVLSGALAWVAIHRVQRRDDRNA